MIHLILKLFINLINLSCRKSPFLNDLIHNSPSEHKHVKRLILFIYGAFVGLIFYHSIDFIGLPKRYHKILVGITCMTCGNICMMSIQFRCISILVCIEAFGKTGRNLIKTLIIALVISGPIHNIIENSKEVVQVFECATYLTYNLTKSKLDLAIMPFINAFSHMERNLSIVKESFRDIENVVSPIIQEIEEIDNYTKG